MSWPKISIVTPSYNQGRYLDATLRSVLEQDYPNLEYIVIDGGSTDNSVEIIRKYESRLTYWISEKDAGQTNAINKGFAKATGDIYGFINSDDLIVKGTFNKLADAYRAGAQWMVGWAMYFDDDGMEWPFPIGPHQHPVDWFIGNPIPQQASYWSGKVHRELGQLDETYHYAFDFEWWMRLHFKANIHPHIIRNHLGMFRLHNQSKTVSGPDRFEPEDHAIRMSYLQYLSPADRLRFHMRYRKSNAEKHLIKGWAALKENNVDQARKHAAERLKRAMASPDSWRLMYCSLRGR